LTVAAEEQKNKEAAEKNAKAAAGAPAKKRTSKGKPGNANGATDTKAAAPGSIRSTCSASFHVLIVQHLPLRFLCQSHRLLLKSRTWRTNTHSKKTNLTREHAILPFLPSFCVQVLVHQESAAVITRNAQPQITVAQKEQKSAQYIPCP